MKTPEITHFDNNGYILDKLSDEQLKPIWDEINKIQSDFSKARSMHHELAGNIEQEYEIVDSIPHVASFIGKYVDVYGINSNYLNELSHNTKPCKFKITKMWVNFQKKDEINPPHNHPGVYSFVIWMKIPFLIDDEKNCPRSKNSTFNIPAHFQFLYINTLGKIRTVNLPIDKNWEGTICFFPSQLTHMVMPFTTSDDYRITIAGNIAFDINNSYEN